MIFNRVITEEEYVENLIGSSNMDKGVALCSYYNEDYNDILITEPLYIYENAPSIPAKDLYITDKNTRRYIIVGGSADGGHGPRMKISEKGPTGKGATITLKFNKNNEIDIIGNPDDINMKSKELKKYKEFAIRNKELIKLAPTENLDDINKAIIKDAKLYNDKIPYKRDDKGNLTIYDKNTGNIISVEDLKGRKLND